MPRARGSNRSSGSSSTRSRGRRKVVADGVPRRSSRRLRSEEVLIESDDDDDDGNHNYRTEAINDDEEFREWMDHDVTTPCHEETDGDDNGGRDPLAQPDFVIPDDDYEGQVYVHGVLERHEDGTVIIGNNSEMEQQEQHVILEDESDPLECDHGMEGERPLLGEDAQELSLHDGLAVMVLSPSHVLDSDEHDGVEDEDNIEVITLSDDSDDDGTGGLKKSNTYEAAVDSLSIFNECHSPNRTANNHSSRQRRSPKSARALQSSSSGQKSSEVVREPENITYTITPTLLEVAAKPQRTETATSIEVCESGGTVVSHSMSDSRSSDPLQYCSEDNNLTDGEETVEVTHSTGESPEKSQYLEVILEEGRSSVERELPSVNGSKSEELNEDVNKESFPSSPLHVDETSSLTASCLVDINEEVGDTMSNCDISDPLCTEGITEPVESSANMTDELRERIDENIVEEEPVVNSEDTAIIQVENEQRVRSPTAEGLERVSSDVSQIDKQAETLTKKSKRGGNWKRGRAAKKISERLPSTEKQKGVKNTRMGSRRGRLTRLASKSSSTTETSSEAEAQIRLQDEMQKEAGQMEVLSDSSSEDNDVHSGHDDDDDSVTNEIVEPKRRPKYRTRLGRKNLARYKAEMAENSKKANKSSNNSVVSNVILPPHKDVVVPTVSHSASEDPETPLAKETVERQSPPDLGPPVLSPITSVKFPNGSVLDESNKHESAIISSTDNSFEVPQSSSAEELPDIDDVPLPVPPSLQAKMAENDGAVIVPTTTAESTDMSAPPVEISTTPAMGYGDSGGKRNDIVRDVIKKTNAPPGVKKHLYTVEHRNYLYRDGAFVAEREDLGLEGSIFLWRILKKEKKLQKFVPVVVDKKECHYGVSIFLPLENMDEDFYNKYQPVLFDLLGNSDDFVIGMYYNISRCLPVMGYFPLSDQLYEQFQYFLKFMTIRAMVDHAKMPTEGEIRARIGPAVNTAVEAVETHIAKTIEGIMFRNQWPRDVVYCLLEYPHLALTKVGLKKNADCEPCKRLGKQGVAAYKLAFHGKCYDPDTLAVIDKEGGAWPDYHYCYSCPQSLRALHRLVHFKYWVFMAIRLQLRQQYKRLKPGEKFQSQGMFDYITKDFVWTKRMFYEFQTICGEGLQAKDRTDRHEKTQVKKITSATKERRPPGRPPGQGNNQGTPKKIVAVESSTMSPKQISFATEQEPEMPTIELCSYEDIADPAINNTNTSEDTNLTDLAPLMETL